MQFFDIQAKPGIYCFENIDKASQRLYIGSSVNIKRRIYYHLWQLHNETHTNIDFQRGYNKYKGENWIVYSLEYNDNIDSLFEREQVYFDTFLYAQEYIITNGRDSRFKKNAYNLNPTADGGRGFKQSEERILLAIQLALKSWNNPEFVFKQITTRNKAWWAEHTKRLNEAKDNDPTYIPRLKASSKLAAIGRMKSVLIYNRFTGLFENEILGINNVVDFYGTGKRTVQRVLNGKRRFWNDYIFKYKLNDRFSLQIEPVVNKHKNKEARNLMMEEKAWAKVRKPIEQLDLDKNWLADFNCASQAASELGLSKSSIGKVCRGVQNSPYGGFYWKFKEINLSLYN